MSSLKMEREMEEMMREREEDRFGAQRMQMQQMMVGLTSAIAGAGNATNSGNALQRQLQPMPQGVVVPQLAAFQAAYSRSYFSTQVKSFSSPLPCPSACALVCSSVVAMSSFTESASRSWL